MLQHDILQHLPFHFAILYVKIAQLSLAELNQCQVWAVNILTTRVKTCNTHAGEASNYLCRRYLSIFGAMSRLDKLSCAVHSLSEVRMV